METEQAPEPVIETPKRTRKVPVTTTMLLIVILLLLAGSAGAYWQRDMAAKDQQKKQETELTELRQKVSNLEKDLTTEKAKSGNNAPAAQQSTAPSAAAIESIKASITSGNTAALEGYMASTVKVIIAASEGIGDRTPVQAVGDITSYISSATQPWNFSLPAATLTDYGTGDYAQYFPSGAIVGKSANNMVISFAFNNTGKINTVFMAASAGLL